MLFIPTWMFTIIWLFGLELRKFPKKEIDQRVQKAAEILGIENLLKRKIKQFSSGLKTANFLLQILNYAGKEVIFLG